MLLVYNCLSRSSSAAIRSFIQFVCTLWSFFTMTPERFGTFVFFIFDLQKMGTMTVAEVPSVVKQVHRKYFAESPALQGAVDKLLKGPGGTSRVLSAEDFATWTFANPDVCRPVLGKQVIFMATVSVYAFAVLMSPGGCLPDGHDCQSARCAILEVYSAETV